jgi:hypothetical protein
VVYRVVFKSLQCFDTSLISFPIFSSVKDGNSFISADSSPAVNVENNFNFLASVDLGIPVASAIDSTEFNQTAAAADLTAKSGESAIFFIFTSLLNILSIFSHKKVINANFESLSNLE